MGTHIFTYGSLMFPEVWRRVVRGDYRFAPAAVAGHARYEISGESYPAMLVQPGASVQGVLYFDVDAPDLERLDAFEGTDYRRIALAARLASGESVPAAAYLYLVQERVAATPWLPEAFRMREFFDTYVRDKLGE